jgi:hypothetical protein
MISNLGHFAHPKKKASGMAKRSVGLKPQLGNQGNLPAPPKSKADPVNMNVKDVSRAGATPGLLLSTPIGPDGVGRTSTAKKPGKKTLKKGTVVSRAKKATVPFFGGY